MFKKTILVDFDGVIHSYVSDWKGIDIIPDPPVHGAISWLLNMLNMANANNAIEIAIYSTRNASYKGRKAMKKWLVDNGMFDHKVKKIKFPKKKIKAWLTIDDRCIRFDGMFPSEKMITEFKPWYRNNYEADGLTYHHEYFSQPAKSIVDAAIDLFDNRIGWSEGRNPQAPIETWIRLGIAIYGKKNDMVLELVNEAMNNTMKPEYPKENIYSSKGLKLGYPFKYENVRYIATSFPTRSTVCGTNFNKSKIVEPLNCKVPISKVKILKSE